MLLRRLSVFAGGWTLEAAEAVCTGAELEAWEVVDGLAALVAKSLVQYETSGQEARYRLLETVRQYSRDRLLEAGKAAAVRDRHRDWFLALAERAEPHLRFGAEQVAWLDRLETEHENLRAAFHWSQEADGGVEVGLRLAGALTWFWIFRSHLVEAGVHRRVSGGAGEAGGDGGAARDTPAVGRRCAAVWGGRSTAGSGLPPPPAGRPR